MSSLFDDRDETPSAWGQGNPPPDALQRRSIKRDLLNELREGWNLGQPDSIAHLIDRWPNDPSHDPDVANLLAEDYHQRQVRGQYPTLDDYQRDFPAHADSLRQLVSRQRLFQSLGDVSARPGSMFRLPEIGDRAFGFHLRYALGSGAFASVYLAEQHDLAGRPVVLKVSAVEGSEPQTLAQMQHTNIVPIYSVHEDLRAGVRAVCMPYFGGASLTAVLEKLWEWDRPSQGREFVEALAAVRAPSLDELNHRGQDAANDVTGSEPLPAILQELSGYTLYQTAAWVVAQVADGLHHAHQRGILHRDIKPSNILISAEGQPLLLDFNLAQEEANQATHATLGGTVAYMAPEHLRALANPTESLVARVDQRSDIYSLGMVLAEFLIGRHPFDESGSYSALPLEIEAKAVERGKCAPSVRATHPDIPWSLESIVLKCLAPDPDHRYQSPDQLADDLRRFLGDQPLRHAPELSRVEQFQKYIRRHPRLTSTLSVGAAAAVAVLFVSMALVGVSRHLHTTRERLAQSHAVERFQAHEAGTTRALCRINTAVDLHNYLREGWNEGIRTLHLYDQRGQRPLDQHPDWKRLTPDQRRRLAEDRRELLTLLAGAEVRLNPGKPEALRQALRWLDSAEKIPGLPPSRAIWIERANNLEQLGDGPAATTARAQAVATPAASARDYYLLATIHARTGTRAGYSRAIEALDQALALNPRHYWSLVQRGICHLELGEPISAAGDFGTCIGLWPEFSWAYFNRGCVYDRSGRKREAIADYTAALKRDPTFRPSYINRGLAHLELKHYDQALADLNTACDLGPGDATLFASRGIALEALKRYPEADRAFASALARLDQQPQRLRDRVRWTIAFAIHERRPEDARQTFEEILEVSPRCPQAHYGLGMLAAARNRADEAIGHFEEAIQANSTFMEARRSRAVMLARMRQWDNAEREINWCLEREPSSPATLYAAACVTARAAEQSPNRASIAQVIKLLRLASEIAPLPGNAANDPDLASVRELPEFRSLLVMKSSVVPRSLSEQPR